MAGTNGSWRPTAALLDWAFAHGARVAPVGRLVQPGSAAAVHAGRWSSVQPAPAVPFPDPARAPDPAAGGDGGGPGGGDTQRAAALRVPAHAPAHRLWAGGAGLATAALMGLLVARRRAVVRRRQQARRRKSRPFA